MIKTTYVDDFLEFYATYGGVFKAHYKEFADTCGLDKELNLDIALFQHLIDLGNYNILLIKDDEEFVGYVCIAVSPSMLFRREASAVIEHLYITEEYRGRNHAKSILSEIETILKDEGVDKLSIGFPTQDKYKHFASKLGYTPESSVYYKILGEN